MKTKPWGQLFLERNGIRNTQARRAILEVMGQNPGHLSTEEVYRKVNERYPHIGLTTVYRTLNILSRIGVVGRFNFGEGKARYELIDGPNGPPHHHHLVCSRCGSIHDYTDFVEEELELMHKTERALSDRYDFRINKHILHFYGLCGECSETSE
jgi:Fur family ferric uptake transcriptional regulator